MDLLQELIRQLDKLANLSGVGHKFELRSNGTATLMRGSFAASDKGPETILEFDSLCEVIAWGGSPPKEGGLLADLVQKLARQAWLGQSLYVCQLFSEGDCMIVSAPPVGPTKHIAALDSLSALEQWIRGKADIH